MDRIKTKSEPFGLTVGDGDRPLQQHAAITAGSNTEYNINQSTRQKIKDL